jgi:hypothetical protein
MVYTLKDPGGGIFEPDSRSRLGREAWGCVFWLIAIVCAVGGTLSVWHLRMLRRDCETARARVLYREGSERPMYMYEFTVNNQKFRGTWVGPDQPLYEAGDSLPVAYYRPDPHLSNGGTSLEHGPLETPRGWFISAGIAAFCGMWLLSIAKYAPKEFPWS